MSQKPRSTSGAKETVLLRQAVPKYNFNARKLPRECPENVVLESRTDNPSSETKETGHDLTKISQMISVSNFAQKTDSHKLKPVAVVGASLQSTLTGDRRCSQKDADSLQPTKLSSVASFHDHTKKLDQQDGDVRELSSHLSVRGLRNSSLLSTSLTRSESACNHPSSDVVNPRTRTDHILALPSPFPQNEDLNLTLGEYVRSYEHFKLLENECDKLKRDLEVQLKVNAELKRLLVASIGDDLSQCVERLSR